MSSQSLYRKWRSRSFEDIVGQPHVVRTLRNAVSNGRIAHAYLFTGPRGTGKTSMARIMAKAVNCLHPQNGSPCNVCSVCVSISEGRSPDVIEIDGASNNGIDDIRALRERAGFAPVEGRYKVYIIDEVHRVTAQGFDALLKTLEEPPAHILFIFASTEPHKVPGTILSRCQRFDFRKIDRATTIQRVVEVADAEGIQLEPEATALIAQQAGGSLRDALGILDQVRTFAAGTVTAQVVREGAGIGRPELVATVTEQMLAGDIGGALRTVNEAVDMGVDPRSLTHQIVDYWRALLLFASGSGDKVDIDPVLVELGPKHSAALEPVTVIHVLRALTEQVIEPRLNVSPQLPLEIALVQAILALRPGEASEPRSAEISRQSEPAAPESKTSRRIRESPVHPAAEIHHEPPLIEDSLSTTEPNLNSLEEMSPPPPLDISKGTATNGPSSLPDVWPRIIDEARSRSRRLQAVLKDAKPVEWTEDELTLAFPYLFHRNEADSHENRAAMQSLIADVTGTRFKVRCILASPDELNVASDDMDSFVHEAERMLRGVHARQFRQPKTDS